MRLTPAERLALDEVTRFEGRMTGSHLGEILGLSEASGRRILRSLVRKEALIYIRRGQYRLTAERSDMTAERSPSIVPISTSTSTREQVLLPDPKGSVSKGASHPLMGSGIPGKISDGSGGGWDEFDPGDRVRKPKKRKGKLRMHRLTPREEWTMQHVVQEFALRAEHAYPERNYPSDGRKLLPALNTFQAYKGLTPGEATNVVDSFFSSPSSKIPPEVTPTEAFLRYLEQWNIARLQGLKVIEDIDDVRRRGEERI